MFVLECDRRLHTVKPHLSRLIPCLHGSISVLWCEEELCWNSLHGDAKLCSPEYHEYSRSVRAILDGQHVWEPSPVLPSCCMGAQQYSVSDFLYQPVRMRLMSGAYT
mmetsp:Transcript_28914/g.72081  ORF Transcript_28914/g.72081 Transcript_28914/m.72081 type:complete len:107 (-) Transcript_28914:305-625(-)